MSSFSVPYPERFFFPENIFSCIEYGKLDGVKHIISNNYDVNNIEWGRRPITTACAYMRHDIIKFLIEAGSDVNLEDGCGTCPLYIACSQHGLSVDTLSLLISSGTDVNVICGMYSFSPIMTACKHCSVEVVEYLIKMGADINHKNHFGNSSLNIAMIFGRDKLAAKLFFAGADTSVLNSVDLSYLKKIIGDDNWERRRIIMMTRNSVSSFKNPIIGGNIDIFKHIVAYI